MRKLTIAAALIAAVFASAKAQSINFVTDCETPTRAINLKLEHTHSEKLDDYNVSSHCPTQEMPTYRLPVGNYRVYDIAQRTGETWFYKIERNGKELRKGELTTPFYFVLTEADKLTIIIAAPVACNCDTKK